jgi:putative ABC transport system permease protein
MRLAGAGLAVGMLAAMATTGLMADLLFRIGPRDPVTYIAIGLILTSVALFASWVPARKAVRTDPTAALRTD